MRWFILAGMLNMKHEILRKIVKLQKFHKNKFYSQSIMCLYVGSIVD